MPARPPTREPSSLVAAHDWWAATPGGGRLPARAYVADALRQPWAEFSLSVRVRTAPVSFAITHVGPGMETASAGRVKAGDELEGVVASENWSHIVGPLFECAERGRPVFADLMPLFGPNVVYRRVLLPFSGPAGRVAEILSVLAPKVW